MKKKQSYSRKNTIKHTDVSEKKKEERDFTLSLDDKRKNT